MTIASKKDASFLVNGLNLQVTHLAKGTHPCHVQMAKHSVNIFFFVLENPDNKSYIKNYDSGKRHVFKKGVMYFRPCFSLSDVHLTDDVEFISIHFNMDICYGTDIFQNSEFMKIPSDEYPERLLRLINSTNDMSSICELKSILYSLAALVLKNAPNEFLSAKWDDYRDLYTFVKKSCSARLTVDALAEQMNLRREVFSRRFKRDTGLSPKEFLTRILLRKASQSLIKPGIPLKEVAAELDFSNEYYFSRFFKKHFGITPGQYRKQIHSGVI